MDKSKRTERSEHFQEPNPGNTTEAERAHEKLLSEIPHIGGKPPKPDSKTKTIEWPGGKRTFERDAEGHIAKVTEKDGTYYEMDGSFLASHKKRDSVISSGSLHVDEKTNEVNYYNGENHTTTILKPDGSSLVRQHIARQHIADFRSNDGPILEIHNPPKADGSEGDIRKFTYDSDGHITGYSLISSNKNLTSNWKTSDGVHWRKVDAQGNPIKDKDLEKDAKNVLIGRMYVTADGTFAFDNKRTADDETPHWTVVTADGSRHERITNLENKKASESLHSLQAELVKAHFDEIKPQNPVGWVGLIGMGDIENVLKDPERTEAQKLSAAILKKYMNEFKINMVHVNAVSSKLFKDTLAQMSLQDIAYEDIKMNNKH